MENVSNEIESFYNIMIKEGEIYSRGQNVIMRIGRKVVRTPVSNNIEDHYNILVAQPLPTSNVKIQNKLTKNISINIQVNLERYEELTKQMTDTEYLLLTSVLQITNNKTIFMKLQVEASPLSTVIYN